MDLNPSLSRRVVIVAPDFTPSGQPPALRARFFANHLVEQGWHVTVITADTGAYDWPVDPENEELVSDSVEVIRTSTLPLTWTRRVGIGDIGLRSLFQQWQALRRLCRSGQVDAVFISISPFFTAVLGRLVWQEWKIPYVIDYIDPWVNDFYLTQPVALRPGRRKWILAHRLAGLLEPLALKHVAGLTAVSQGTIDGITRRYAWLRGVPIAEIPYGAESGDFAHIRQYPRRNVVFDPHDGCMHVSYLGTVGAGMRGTVRAVFQAVRAGLDQYPEQFEALRLHFVGTTYAPGPQAEPQILDMAAECGVTAVVREHPARISYLDTLQTLTDSHGLVVVGSQEPHYTASKLFPYILAERPLIAVTHEASSVVNIMRESMAGEVITFSEDHPAVSKSGEIMEALRGLLTVGPAWRPTTRWDVFERYTTATMTRILAGVLDCAITAGRE